MEQINPIVFYDLGGQLQNCYNSAFAYFKFWTDAPKRAKETLGVLLRGDAKYFFDESRSAAEALLPVLDRIIAAGAANPDGNQTQDEVNEFNFALFRFISALQLELGRAPIFLVTPKGVYDTRRLIQHGDAVYEGYADRLPSETIADTIEAGRCLAFGLSTAAGFHIARATEAVIRKYMDAYSCPKLPVSQRNWGKFIESLVTQKAPDVVTNHLTQLKNLHRNPLVHPEVTLTIPEANSLWAMCVSVIQAMVADMEKKLPIPSPSVTAMLPATTI